MRHRVKNHSFGRKPSARKALMRGLVDSLVEHGRIRTTVTKAKELRRIVEKAITSGKKGDVNTRRVLLAKYPNKTTVKSIVDDLSVRFKDRPGGYTRIMKMGPRPGDQADMAYIEFVDYELPAAGGEETVEGDAKAAANAKAHAKKVAKARKARRQIQNESRRINRG